MDASEAEAFVIELLRQRGPLSTMEIEKLARKKHKRCPDQTVIFLTKMRKKGMIKGEASMERRGWVWWYEDEDSRSSSIHKST
jgi:predicted transcriptional regulator